MSLAMILFLLVAVIVFAGFQALLAIMLERSLRRESRALRRIHAALAIHLVGDPLRRDPDFVKILECYRRTPRELLREDRIRARSWIRSASRIYGLALRESDADSNVAWGVPAMGERHSDPGSPDLPSVEELIDLDPEFLSFVDALRSS